MTSQTDIKMASKDSTNDHHHGKGPLVAYFIGLAFAVLAFLLPAHLSPLKNILFILSTLAAGYHAVILEGIQDTIQESRKKGRFSPNAHVLMGLAALGSALLGQFWEACLLILIFAGAHFLEEYAENRSKAEIKNLLAMNPNQARLIQEDGQTIQVPVETLKIGDKLQVLNGDQVPVDGVVLSGQAFIDESAINGESLPQEKEVGDSVFAATKNGSRSFTMEVTKESQDSVFASILELVNQNDQNKNKAAHFIDKYESSYVNIVILLCLAFALLMPLLFSWSFSQSIQTSLTLLVAASPCALAAASVSASLSAMSQLARKGVLSKGSAFLSSMGDIKAIAFDKTGTLTQGQPEIVGDYFVDDGNRQSMIDIVLAMEKESSHPLAHAFLNQYHMTEEVELEIENIVGQGLSAKDARDNYQIAKPSVFDQVPEAIQLKRDEWEKQGCTCVYFAKNGQVYAVFALLDKLKEEAYDVMAYLKEQNIHAVMISGDSQQTVAALATELGMDEFQAGVMPEDKSAYIEKIQEKYGATAMVGDGINDAPALVQADVGIAMGQGTDIAVDVSDLVLMQNQLEKLVLIQQVGKKMNRIILQNILFALLVVGYLVISTLFSWSNLSLNIIFHEASTLIVILNGLRLLR